MRCLSERSRQQCNLLWWLFVLDTQEMQWHKGAPCALTLISDARCLGTARPFDGRTVLIKKSLRLSQEFCYLGNMLYAGGGYELAAVIRCKCGWGQFRQLLYLLTDHNLLLVNRGRVYLTCVRSVMLHVAETWAMTAATLNRLPGNDRAMIRSNCNVKARDKSA